MNEIYENETKMKGIRLKKKPEHSRTAHKIAVMNNKGGAGKTTLSFALSLYLARCGYNVLCIDTDPQCNLSQRMGIMDDSENCLGYIFKSTGTDNVNLESILMNKGIIVNYKYQKALGEKKGKLTLIPGSHRIETDAKNAQDALSKQTIYRSPMELIDFFQTCIKYYEEFYDYIIFDTSPAMEGSKMCELVVQSVNDVICPIDGIEAAFGSNNLIEWFHAMNRISPSTMPNVIFVMMKYQKDKGGKLRPDGYLNSVHAIMKKYLDGYVCDLGIEEKMTRRRELVGIRSSSGHEPVCVELGERLNTERDSIFKYWNVSLAKGFTADLIKLNQSMLLGRGPKLSMPLYARG